MKHPNRNEICFRFQFKMKKMKFKNSWPACGWRFRCSPSSRSSEIRLSSKTCSGRSGSASARPPSSGLSPLPAFKSERKRLNRKSITLLSFFHSFPVCAASWPSSFSGRTTLSSSGICSRPTSSPSGLSRVEPSSTDVSTSSPSSSPQPSTFILCWPKIKSAQNELKSNLPFRPYPNLS